MFYKKNQYNVHYPKQGVNLIILISFQSIDKTTSECTRVGHLEMYYNF